MDGHIARMREMRGACRVLVRKPEGKRPLGRTRLILEDHIKMALQEVGYEDTDWIYLVQDMDRCRGLLKAVMDPRVPQNARNFLIS